MEFFLAEHSRQAELSDSLADCLERVRAGASIESALAAHAAHAAEIEPLLRTALTARASLAAPIRENRRLSARSEFLQAAARQSHAARLQAAQQRDRTLRPPAVLTRPLWSTFAPAVAAAALFVVALVPIMSITSTSALPGDWNYSFKRSTELVRLALTLNPADRLNMELAFHDRRLGELEQLAATGRLNDPTLVDQLTNETSALVQTVSNNPRLGPSEALKVVQQTQAQVLVLNDKIAPLAPASVQPAINNAVQQTQQVEAQASQVAQAKVDAAQTQSSNGPAKYPRGGGVKSALPDTSAATPTPTATAATATATATASPSPSPSPSASPSPSGTAVALVPPPQAAPALRAPASSAPASASAPVLQIPSIPSSPQSAATNASSATAVVPPASPQPTPPPTPAPLVPPAQPPNAQQVVVKLLPPGQPTTLVYNGPELPVPQALASIAGSYDAVFFTQPQHGGAVYPWYPGLSDPRQLLEPGSLVTIQVKPGAPATLTYVVPGSSAGR